MMLNAPERVVVDTSVVSILFRGHRDVRYEYYNQRIGESLKIVSFQTLEELWFGAYLRNWGGNRISAFAEHLSAYRVIYPNRASSAFPPIYVAIRENWGASSHRRTLG